MNTRITQSMTIRTVLRDVQAASGRLSQTQQKLSSGKQITAPSDDPSGATRALQFRADLAATEQYGRNVREAEAWQSVTDTALNQVGDLTQRARELVIQGANDTVGPTGRNTIALEIEQLIDSIKSAANAQYAGRFVFAGSATQAPPYQLGANDAYAGNSDMLQREIGVSIRLDVNETGLAVIGQYSPGPPPTGSGLLNALRTAAADLRSGNTTALQSADLQALDAAQDTVTTARARTGARANRLEIALSRLDELALTTNKLLSETEDADMAKTLIDYSMQQAVYQSALKSGANVIQLSLIDFIR